MKHRCAVKIAYKGTNFSGSQIQPGLTTVEGNILESLKNIFPESKNYDSKEDFFEMQMASRTDKGVNALGNVVAFNYYDEENESKTSISPKELLKALNSQTKDVYFLSFATVAEDFRPRHALNRQYEYLLYGFDDNIDAIKQACQIFNGVHDFSGYCKNETNKSTTIDLHVEVNEVEVEGMIAINFVADHFLWNMLRRIVAAITKYANSRIDIQTLQASLTGGWSNFGMAEAKYLTLMDICYPIEDAYFQKYDDIALKFKKSAGLYEATADKLFFSHL